MALFKKSGYKDYTKVSEYFNADNEAVLAKDIESTEKSKGFFIWVQEFTKKVVTIAFIIYIISQIFSMGLIWLSYLDGYIEGLDTLIMETNDTFRQVIGGYLIKAAVENVVKIGGNYYVGICDARIRAIEEEQELKSGKESVKAKPVGEDEFTTIPNPVDDGGNGSGDTPA